jgi:hypothetical protein
VRLAGAVSYAQVHLRNAGVSGQALRPAARLTTWVSPLRPLASVVRPLGVRDASPDPPCARGASRGGRSVVDASLLYALDDAASEADPPALVPLHELVLEYRFAQPKQGKKQLVTPHLLAAHGEVYESLFTGSMCSLFETATRLLVAVRDASAPAQHFGPLVAGRQYTLLCQLRHENPEVRGGLAQLQRLDSAVVLRERLLIIFHFLKIGSPVHTKHGNVARAAVASRRALVVLQGPRERGPEPSQKGDCRGG